MTDANHLIAILPYPGLFVAIILGSLGLPLPEEAMLLLCGYFISRGAILPAPGILVVFTAVLASDSIIFILGRLYDRRLLCHRFFYHVFSIDRLSCLEDGFTKIAPFLIIFGRHLFGLKTKIIYMSSVMGIPPHRFFLIDSIAATISVAVMVLIGYAGGNWIQSSMPDNQSSAYPIAIALLVLASVFIFFRHLASFKKKCPANDARPSQVQGHSMIDN